MSVLSKNPDDVSSGSLARQSDSFYARKREQEEQRDREIAKLSPSQRRAADRLAYAVAKCVERGVLDARSGPADALLDYLQIGQTDGHQSVPEWVAEYEAKSSR